MYTKDRQTLVSTLTIKNSTLADTGTYACRVFDHQQHSETTVIDIMVHSKYIFGQTAIYNRNKLE